ncbi:hypothetical protein [Pseudoxanthomonas taiwanensis]|nr:hypothetical protein [Pseudoxanthomonas taiwanensis]
MRMHTLAAIIAASLAAAMAPARAVEASADNDSGVQASAARDEGVSDQGGAADQGAQDAASAANVRAGGSDRPVLFHFAGYADVTYVNSQDDDAPSVLYTLAPILHVQLGDRFFVESEFEMEGDNGGERETAVEYATINWLINDQAALVVGKFLSPAGYFFQNLHPSWINRLASVPAGFGHGGAAPLTDVGVQLRGGRTFDNGQHINYAIYYANGPRLGLEDMEGLDLDVEGSTRNPDGERVVGGRLGWMPVPNLELGVSAVKGNVVLDTGEMAMGPEPSRSYRVEGVDAVWRPVKALELRGEWIRQQVGAAAASIAPDGARWRAWYAQGVYRFGADRWEAVLRYGDSDSPHGESTFTQTAIGLNYLYRPHRQVKLTCEFNDSDDAEASADRLLLQLAYGF